MQKITISKLQHSPRWLLFIKTKFTVSLYCFTDEIAIWRHFNFAEKVSQQKNCVSKAKVIYNTVHIYNVQNIWNQLKNIFDCKYIWNQWMWEFISWVVCVIFYNADDMSIDYSCEPVPSDTQDFDLLCCKVVKHSSTCIIF